MRPSKPPVIAEGYRQCSDQRRWSIRGATVINVPARNVPLGYYEAVIGRIDMARSNCLASATSASCPFKLVRPKCAGR